jgi:hypothetical protein
MIIAVSLRDFSASGANPLAPRTLAASRLGRKPARPSSGLTAADPAALRGHARAEKAFVPSTRARAREQSLQRLFRHVRAREEQAERRVRLLQPGAAKALDYIR